MNLSEKLAVLAFSLFAPIGSFIPAIPLMVISLLGRVKKPKVQPRTSSFALVVLFSVGMFVGAFASNSPGKYMPEAVLSSLLVVSIYLLAKTLDARRIAPLFLFFLLVGAYVGAAVSYSRIVFDMSAKKRFVFRDFPYPYAVLVPVNRNSYAVGPCFGATGAFACLAFCEGILNRIGGLILGILSFGLVAFAGTRAAIFGAAVGLGVSLAFAIRRFKLWGLLTAFLIVALVFSFIRWGPGLMDRIAKTNGWLRGCINYVKGRIFVLMRPERALKDPRFAMYRQALKIIAKTPIVGVGLDGTPKERVKDLFEGDAGRMLKQYFCRTHNSLLTAWLLMGLPGMLFVALFYALAIWFTILGLIRDPKTAVVFAAPMWGIIAHSIFDEVLLNLSFGPFALFMLFMLEQAAYRNPAKGVKG